MLTQWHQQGMKEGLRKGKAEGISQGLSQGITEGISQGIAKGKQETLIRLMQRKFGELPDDVLTIIQEISNVDILDELADRVLDAKTIDEMRLHEIK
jgi:flagellar biosynthesis/type III secretory pathway protein FliH